MEIASTAVDESEHLKTQSLSINSAFQSQSAGALTLWVTYSFAPEWFNDAKAEVNTPPTPASRRREILFAVCFAETYLYEWVRDQALQRDFSRLADFFPIQDRRGIRERWKEVTKKLAHEGLMPRAPDFNDRYWHEFTRLVDYRDGLVHALASRPESASLASGEEPRPSIKTLDTLAPGWPTRVVVALLQHLHDAGGTKSPDWLTLPE